MTDRWAVVELLERGLPYREIHWQTGVSVIAIGRVAHSLDLVARCGLKYSRGKDQLGTYCGR